MTGDAMKRASYRDGVDWIACNDEPSDRDLASVAGFISVILLATIFGVDAERVAADVIRQRKRDNI